MPDQSVCPGCGLIAEVGSWTPDPRLHASAECWQTAAEVTAFELSYPELAGRVHQLNVDAYGAQHAGGATPSIRLAYSLVGLHLALDRGLSGIQVRAAHQRMGRPDATWPLFPRPVHPGELTILDVAEVGPRAESIAGCEQAMWQWAESVWRSWNAEHAAVIALTHRVLGPWLARHPDLQ